MKEELKKCPFCGWGAKISVKERRLLGQSVGNIVSVDCSVCEAAMNVYTYKGGPSLEETKKRAAEAWNTRA